MLVAVLPLPLLNLAWHRNSLSDLIGLLADARDKKLHSNRLLYHHECIVKSSWMMPMKILLVLIRRWWHNHTSSSTTTTTSVRVNVRRIGRLGDSNCERGRIVEDLASMIGMWVDGRFDPVSVRVQCLCCDGWIYFNEIRLLESGSDWDCLE